jgi:hypothetical protein
LLLDWLRLLLLLAIAAIAVLLGPAGSAARDNTHHDRWTMSSTPSRTGEHQQLSFNTLCHHTDQHGLTMPDGQAHRPCYACEYGGRSEEGTAAHMQERAHETF